ncbi:MAG TPA: peptide deformylase [bacterium]|nr:peptide deformylase [bacterium]
MTLLHISTAGDPVLRKKAKPVKEIDEYIKTLIKDMAETMKAASGLGLAAPQIGVSLRIFIIDIGYLEFVSLPEKERKNKEEPFNPVALINPEIIEKTGQNSVSEGCLSVPGYHAEVERAAEITCRFTDIDGKEQIIKAIELTAIAIQHEFDHLEGVLFIDRISNLKKNIAVKKVRKYLQNIKENGDDIENTLYGKP